MVQDSLHQHHITAIITFSRSASADIQTLESLCRQTGFAIDLKLIIDNDNTNTNHLAPYLEIARFGNSQILNPGQSDNYITYSSDCIQTEFVLLLEAGTELFSRCLERLSCALCTSNAAFAYPIIAGAMSHPDFENYLPWDIEIMKRCNGIRLPVLLRTSCLRAIEGLILRWFHPNLWLQLANRGFRGCLVPEILARRHIH